MDFAREKLETVGPQFFVDVIEGRRWRGKELGDKEEEEMEGEDAVLDTEEGMERMEGPSAASVRTIEEDDEAKFLVGLHSALDGYCVVFGR